MPWRMTFAIVATLVVFCGPSCPSNAQDRRPNFVFIMADDLGYGDLSCYGHRTIRTPHLDELARGGVRCTDFHSNGAVCSPTRAALMTGRYQQRCGVNGVITAANHRDKGLALSEWTLGEAMKKPGYETALFGKWHLGYQPRFNPVHQGFDRFNGFVSGNIDYRNHIDQEGYFDWWVQDELRDEPGYLTDLITQHAVDFIQKERAAPFLLVVHHGAPHYPIQGRNDPGIRVIGASHKDQPRPKSSDPSAVYREMIEVMDEGIGRIVKALDEQGIRNNTLIVFCSDNGPAKLGSAGPFRGRKGSVWEGGHRVCGIFNMPDALPEGTECDTTIMTMDMLPTFISLAGGSIDPARELDGVNIWPALKGELMERAPLFWKHGNAIAVRDGKWKLVRRNGGSLLFDLGSDPGETKDLATEHPVVANRLLELIESWESDTGN